VCGLWLCVLGCVFFVVKCVYSTRVCTCVRARAYEKVVHILVRESERERGVCSRAVWCGVCARAWLRRLRCVEGEMRRRLCVWLFVSARVTLVCVCVRAACV
jgi:hypothetical protein